MGLDTQKGGVHTWRQILMYVEPTNDERRYGSWFGIGLNYQY